jgi:hypothetical protein
MNDDDHVYGFYGYEEMFYSVFLLVRAFLFLREDGLRDFGGMGWNGASWALRKGLETPQTPLR